MNSNKDWGARELVVPTNNSSECCGVSKIVVSAANPHLRLHTNLIGKRKRCATFS